MTERELLESLFRLLVNRKFVQGDKDSIMDMVQRYKQPPMTRLHQVVMQMTRADYDELSLLLEAISNHLYPKDNHATDVSGRVPDRSAGDVSVDAAAQ